MRLLIQRVNQASVEVENRVVGSIGKGILVLFGCHADDKPSQIEYLANKLLNLRFFKDDQGKMNRSVLDIKGEILVVSQFTLYADCQTGRRPSFTQSLNPELAKQYYNQYIDILKKSSLNIQTGEFGAYMRVSLVNDGPVTFILDAK